MANIVFKLSALAILLLNLSNPVLSAASPASDAATPTGARAAAGANPSLIGNGAGKQFITGACASDADCASGCCGFNSGLCAGPVVAQERDGGCGFGDAQPNDNAAVASGVDRKGGGSWRGGKL